MSLRAVLYTRPFVVRHCLKLTASCTRHTSNMEIAATKYLVKIMKPAITNKNKGEWSRIMKRKTLQEFAEQYKISTVQMKMETLLFIANNYGANEDGIAQQCRAFLDMQNEKREASALQIERKLSKALKPLYHTLFSQIGSLENGVKFLIDMRRDVLHGIKGNPISEDSRKLKHLSEHIGDILSMWFSVGLLQLKRITWNTPAIVLERLAEYEAVHTVRNWMDLKHRLGVNRRCYAFFHGSMPDEPVVVLHVALTEMISDNITDILSYKSRRDESTMENAPDAKCAIFYSITSTQEGLLGIELGAYLVQSVVSSLRAELPQLKTFSSLSPIPGFRKWMLTEINEKDIENNITGSDSELLQKAGNIIQHNGDVTSLLKELITNMEHLQKHDVADLVKMPLMKLCAVYICRMKRRSYALNSVANFHLKNGAVVWRINWMADKSLSGMKQSCGLMVNYRYYLEQMSDNSMNYITNQIVTVSDSVKGLLNDDLNITSKL